MKAIDGEAGLELTDSEPPEAKIMAAGKRVIEAGIWLIRNGYGRLGILPYAAPSGCYWRCEFQPLGRSSKPIYRYSSSNVDKYLASHCGGSVRSSISAKKLAEAILVSVPEGLAAACSGAASVETLEWLQDLERALNQGYLPQAFEEYTEDYSRWALISLLGLPAATMAPQPGYVRPGEERTVIAEPYWQDAVTRWEALSSAPALVIPAATLKDDNYCYDLANSLRAALNDVEWHDVNSILRGALAVLHTHQVTDDSAPATRGISTTPPADLVARRSGRLLAMVHELHKAGYQRLRICAGMSPDGKEWRCRLLPASKVQSNGWAPAGDGHDYTSAQGKAFFGWTDCDNDDARGLARKFIERFPDTAREAAGADWGYVGWFTDILGRVEHGELPVFYRGFDLAPGNLNVPLPPPPMGPMREEQASPTGFPLIANDALKEEHLPPPSADYESLVPFCLSIDGYAQGLRSIDDCSFIADTVEAKGLAQASIESLRVTAYIRQRAIKWADTWPPDERRVQGIRDVVEELRRRLRS